MDDEWHSIEEGPEYGWVTLFCSHEMMSWDVIVPDVCPGCGVRL